MSHRPNGERLKLIEARNTIFPLSVPGEIPGERIVLPQGAVVPPPRLRVQIGYQVAENNHAETGEVGVVIGDYVYNAISQSFVPTQNRLFMSLAEFVALFDNSELIIQAVVHAQDMRNVEEDARRGRHAVDQVDRMQAARAHVEDRGLVVPTRTLRNGPPARAAAPAVPPVPTQARPAVRARVGDDAAEVAALRTRQGHAVAANTRRNADEDANAAPASHDEDDDDDNNHNNNNASNNNASVNGSVAAAAPRRIASNSTVRATAAAAAAEHRATVARNRGTVRATTRNRGSANAAAQAAYQQGGTVAGPSGSRRNPTRATAARSQTQHTNEICDLTNEG